jgi:hypothetical protein
MKCMGCNIYHWKVTDMCILETLFFISEKNHSSIMFLLKFCDYDHFHNHVTFHVYVLFIFEFNSLISIMVDDFVENLDFFFLLTCKMQYLMLIY